MRFLLFLLLLFNFTLFAKEIYILKSDDTISFYKSRKLNYENYINRIDEIDKIIRNFGYKTKIIGDSDVKNLKSNSILMLFDTLVVSKSNIEKIIEFVKNGGSLYFNFNVAFNSGDYLINKITGFKQYEKFTHFDFKKSSPFATPKILSPITTYVPNGERMDLILYEMLPVFKTPNYLEPDLLATNWQQTSTPTFIKNNQIISISDAGLTWHGSKKRGRWVYCNFPSYSITEEDKKSNYFKKLLRGIVEYLDRDVIVRKYPYVDVDNVVFVSEDTEYRYESFISYYSLGIKYKFPLTAFCVANLSKKYADIFYNAVTSPYLEIASHSTTHKKIIDKDDATIANETIGSKKILEALSKKVNVRGFRPPREEINQKMVDDLIKGKYTYLMEKNKGRLYPFFEHKGLLTIPRTATDDYQYLVSLDWNKKEILKKMKEETKMIAYLNGIYAFSMHTHLMAFSKNITILEDYIKFVKANPYLKPMFGYEVSKKSIQAMNIDIKYQKKGENRGEIIIENRNSENIKNFTFRLYIKPKFGIKLSSNLKLSKKKRDRLNEYNVRVEELPKNSINRIDIELISQK